MNHLNLKSKIFDLFISKGVIVNKTAKHPKRPFCWSKRFDDECSFLWNQYTKQYRTDDEAWFCLMNNIEPPICPVCQNNICKYIDNSCGGKRRYNTTCEFCSANKVDTKKQKFKQTYKNFTQEKRDDIIKKTRVTLFNRYGDDHYMLYGSHLFKKFNLIEPKQIIYNNNMYYDAGKIEYEVLND